MEKRVFKIRIKGTNSYSNGTINLLYDRETKKKHPEVNWTRKGKEWTNEKNVKAHLLKFVSNGGDIGNWEVVEVVYAPTKPIDEWVDTVMLMKILQQNQ